MWKIPPSRYEIYVTHGCIFTLSITTKKDIMKLSIETKTEKALQMVIMDAIEKGHTNTNELIEYMASDVCKKAVQRYINLFEEI